MRGINSDGNFPRNLIDISKGLKKGRDLNRIFKTPFLNALLIQILKGSDIPPHYEDYHAVFYIIEGTGVIQIGSEKIEVKPGSLVYSPKDKLRGISPDERLLILGIQEPH